MTKEIKSNLEYSVGLDLGTTSVGWAVIDKNYKLLKKGSQNMWGSFLFEKGETAAKRRVYRSTRRRMNRRKRRISLLKTLTGAMVIEKDPNFFMRMEKGHVKNAELNQNFNFFEDSFNENDYYKKYPTIYHLRHELCKSKEKMDPRLIYLALHHIIKYRGNFLYEGRSFNISDQNSTILELHEIVRAIIKMYGLNDVCEEEIRAVFQVLGNTTTSKKDRIDEVSVLLKDALHDKGRAKALAQLLLGNVADMSKLFDDSCENDTGKAMKLSFSSSKYEEELAALENISDQKSSIILQCNTIYSFIILKDILSINDEVSNESPSISAAMIEKYNTHKDELKTLKDIVKEYFSGAEYKSIFHDKNVAGNYFNYINDKRNTPQNDDKSFSKYINKVLKENAACLNDVRVEEIFRKISYGKFMPKQNTKDNGAIPYQLHRDELVRILENQKEFYPELNEHASKIIEILEFRIPYYIGPLSNIDDKFSWIVKKDDKAIVYPWNFDEVVDREQSAEAFIRNMTNQCTYLWDKEVLPKKSLIYTKYEVLNELNKINVISNDASGDLKREVFHGLFMKEERVTEKKLRCFLTDRGYEVGEEIKGFQKENEFASSLEPWIKFKKIFPTTFDERMDDIETMIEWISVYEDKRILEKRLKNNFELENSEIKAISKFKFSGWGRLSKELLVDMKCQDENAGALSIMDVLYDTNKNFMQIIRDKEYGFKDKIEEYNKNHGEGENVFETISTMPCSPSVKKGIRQSIKVLEDIVKSMKCDPKNIFIEFAREDQDSKRTDSRLAQISKKYEDIGSKGEYKQIINELKDKLKEKSGIKSKSLLLYFLQGGRCLYTRETLNIDELSTYQVDHILPQSYIKDDSIDNLALVKSGANQHKGDNLLIDVSVQEKQRMWWAWLLNKGLMSEKKWKNLTRVYISEMEEMNFINRQLVETRQITKHVANVLKKEYPNTLIGAIKAGLTTDFRSKFDVYKIRNLNDYHHAHDAYIATVIGTFVLKVYPNLRREFIFEEAVQLKAFKEKLRSMQSKIKNNNQKSLYGFVLNQMDNERLVDDETGEIIWDAGTRRMILNSFEYKDCHIVRKTEQTLGSMFKITLRKLKDIVGKQSHNVIPRGGGLKDIHKYGGYTDIENAHMAIISGDGKKGKIKKLVNVPILYKDKESALIKYLETDLGLLNIRLEKIILMNQKIEFEGGLYYLASASEWNNAMQLLLSKKAKKVVYEISRGRNVNNSDFTMYLNEHLSKLMNYYPLYKGVYTKLDGKREEILRLNKEERAQFVAQMLMLTAANKGNANFDFGGLKMTKREGRLAGRNCKLDSTIFIFSSPTGIFSVSHKL